MAWILEYIWVGDHQGSPGMLFGGRQWQATSERLLPWKSCRVIVSQLELASTFHHHNQLTQDQFYESPQICARRFTKLLKLLLSCLVSLFYKGKLYLNLPGSYIHRRFGISVRAIKNKCQTSIVLAYILHREGDSFLGGSVPDGRRPSLLFPGMSCTPSPLWWYVIYVQGWTPRPGSSWPLLTV